MAASSQKAVIPGMAQHPLTFVRFLLGYRPVRSAAPPLPPTLTERALPRRPAMMSVPTIVLALAASVALQAPPAVAPTPAPPQPATPGIAPTPGSADAPAAPNA